MSRGKKRSGAKKSRKFLHLGWWILFALALTVMICIRIRLLTIPLERDEGEYAYAGQLLLEGIPPYKLAYNMKFPGIYAAYSVVMAAFGQTPAGVHLGLLLVNLITVILLYLVGRMLFGEAGGAAAGSAYAILALSPSVLGFAAHATHFVVLPVMGATLICLRPPEKRTPPMLSSAGALLGTAILMKQPGLFFAVFGGIYLLWTDLQARLSWKTTLGRSLAFLAGIVITLALALFYLWWAGVFGKFWFWTVDYASAYGSLNSWDIGRQYLVRNFPRVVSYGWLLWLLAGVGVTACFWNETVRRQRALLLGLLGASLLALSAGLYFREHYFVLILPAISLLAGAAITALIDLLPARRQLRRVLPLLLLAVALSLPLLGNRGFFFYLSPSAGLRKIWWSNPFSESIPIAKFLRDRTTTEDSIAVLGSEPQIYFYSHRHSATGYIYTYGLMEKHSYARRMQEEMIHEIEAARPKFVVFVSIEPSWMLLPKSDRMILDWINTYLQANYAGVGLVNVFRNRPSEYYLPLESAVPRLSPSRILIYERK